MRRDEIVEAALGWVGTPYHHQASARGVGCDCLGLVRGVWRDVIGAEPEAMPAYTADWAEAHGRETLLEGAARHFTPAGEAKPGSILVFRWKAGAPAKHVGIATSQGRFVHAYQSAGKAVDCALTRPWAGRLAAVFDFPGVAD